MINHTKLLLPCSIIKGMILNTTIAISHIIRYTCATSWSAVQQLCHKFCYDKSSTRSVVEIIRKMFVLLYVICWGYRWWLCCAGLHHLNWCLYFAYNIKLWCWFYIILLPVLHRWSLRSSRSWHLSKGPPGWISCSRNRAASTTVKFLCWKYQEGKTELTVVHFQPVVHQIFVSEIGRGGELLQAVGRRAYRGVIHSTACTIWNNNMLRLQDSISSWLVSHGFLFDL